MGKLTGTRHFVTSPSRAAAAYAMKLGLNLVLFLRAGKAADRNRVIPYGLWLT